MQNSENNNCFGNVRALERRDFYLRWARRCAVVLVAAAFAFAGYRVYGAWRERNLARQTREFFAHGDYQSAVLCEKTLRGSILRIRVSPVSEK